MFQASIWRQEALYISAAWWESVSQEQCRRNSPDQRKWPKLSLFCGSVLLCLRSSVQMKNAVCCVCVRCRTACTLCWSTLLCTGRPCPGCRGSSTRWPATARSRAHRAPPPPTAPRRVPSLPSGPTRPLCGRSTSSLPASKRSWPPLRGTSSVMVSGNWTQRPLLTWWI